MPSSHEHLQVVDNDQKTLDHLLDDVDAHYRWAAIVAFYKAVHIAEAMFFLKDKSHSYSHDNRLDKLKLNPFHPTYKFYKKLYNLSLVARYLETERTEGEECYLTGGDVKDVVIKKWLRNFEQNSISVMRTLGADGKFAKA